MAHNLNINEKTGKASLFVVKEPAWHGLGTVVDEALTSKDAIIKSGLDYGVRKVPNLAAIPVDFEYPDDEQDYVQNERSFSTIREDTREILGTVGAEYQVIQNVDAFDWFDSITEAKEAMFQTAGALNKGEKIFITAKLPSYIRIGNSDDIIEQYLLLFNSHDGLSTMEIVFTPTRVVCNNTLTYALNTANSRYKIRHSKNATVRLKQAQNILQLNNKMAANADQIYNEMAKLKLTDEDIHGYLSKVLLTDYEMQELKDGAHMLDCVSTRKRNMLGDMYRYYHIGAGQNTVETNGTMWGIFNAVTGYYQNQHRFRDDSHKLHSISRGDTLTKTIKAYNIAVESVRAGELVL